MRDPAAAMNDPFRTSAEPYEEAKPDGLEVMRRERAARQRRRAIVVAVPFGIAATVLCAFGLATSLIALHDGVPLGSRQPIWLAGMALGLAVTIYAAWRTLPKIWTLVLLAGALTGAGLWTRSDTAALHARRLASAHDWCRDAPDESTCIEREVRCITGLETAVGEASTWIYIGDPCDARLPED